MPPHKLEKAESRPTPILGNPVCWISFPFSIYRSSISSPHVVTSNLSTGSASSGVMSSLQHGSTGSERDLHSAASSVSLPSVRKNPKKHRLSLHSFFGRRLRPERDSRRTSRTLSSGVDSVVSVESVHTETSLDKTSTQPPSDVASISTGTASSSELLECPLCLLRQTRDRFPDIMTCHHRSCADCLRQYLRIEISESRVNITCPECSERFNPHDIQMILGDRALMEKYEEFMLRRWLVSESDCRWCPAPDCG
ncbi:E3 ubiquitin-protein ligase rnf19a [Xenoophorus captivus]|uniref:E3 ubiquitin-protein ligase rnf19a n=1 Tax=Xenoophorus captivus TaxID=1517983 RepID=A0ABV0RJS9_9TELE